MHMKTSSLKLLGFTLLEMILVLFLLSMLASATLFLTEGVEDQAKYDETKRRIDIIRQAIIGDSTRTLNGAPEVSGFAADMKRLPLCLAELLEVGPASTGDPTLVQSPCDSTVYFKKWSQDGTTKVFSGWRGPYIQVSPESNGDLRFRDGYRNRDSNAVSDARNSGWNWTTVNASEAAATISNTDSIFIQSYGYDKNDSRGYYPQTAFSLVSKNEWTLNNANVSIANKSASGASGTIHLQVYLNKSTDIKTSVSTTISTIASGSKQTVALSFDDDNLVPIGVHGYELFCTSALSSTRCAGIAASQATTTIQTFTVAPKQTPTIDWVIQ